MACPAAAEDIVYVNASATGAGDGSSCDDAFTTVGPALAAAQSGNQVWVAKGTYVGRITLKEGVALYGGFAGTEDPASFDLADRDLEANQTILDGDEAGSVVTAPEGATETTLIDGFIITSGKASDGGGIRCSSSSPTISNCTITGNSASGSTTARGGGIYCMSSSSPTIDNCTITGNSASGSSYGGGGGIACWSSSPTISNCTITGNVTYGTFSHGGGIYCTSSSPTISNCTITGNTAEDGGGIFCDYGSSPTISNCTITGNSASGYNASGGGINCFGSYSSPTISNCTITGNSASGSTTAYGGGIYCRSSSPTISNCTITGNTVSGGGGGIYCDHSSPTISNCTITGNSASGYNARGGGIYCGYSSPAISNCTIAENAARHGGGIYCGSSSSPTISGCTITANTASSTYGGSGGGIACYSSSPTISNCTITGNTASSTYGGYGGGICCDRSSPTISNCTITGNMALDNGGGICCSSYSSPTISNCTITANTAECGNGNGISSSSSSSPTISNCILWNMGSKVAATYSCVLDAIEGEGNISIYPHFVDPDNGDHRLAPWSPCINAGSNELVTEDLDLAGNARIQKGVVDMGAYESSYAPSTDIDGDGLPDLWELEHFGDLWATAEGDPDGDRLSNLREYELGTNPLGSVAYVSQAIINDPDADGSVEHPFPSIQQAIDAKPDAIHVAGIGVYRESIRIEDRAVTLEGGYNPDFTARDIQRYETFIRALEEQSTATIDRSHGIILDGFTITGGVASTGGGIHCSASSLTISNCTITGNTGRWNGGGLYCTTCRSMTINNCTITDNTVHGNGGGIYCTGSSSTISNCTVTGNTAKDGGGIHCGSSSSTTISNCTIEDNTASCFGGGIHCYSSFRMIANCSIAGNAAELGGGIYCKSSSSTVSKTITNCTITGNIAEKKGGGIYFDSSSPTVTNCTIAGNTAPQGGGIYCYASPSTISNCIFWNTGGLVNCTATYSLGGGGEGSILADPRFADVENGDFHLKSRYGRWSPSANGGKGGYVIDTVHSPCIDAGDPASDYGNEPTPNGGRVNMGAYGNTEFASRSGPWWPIPGDANHDCRVDILDLLFVRNRLNKDSSTGDNWLADANGDGKINILDMLYVRNRMGTTCPTE